MPSAKYYREQAQLLLSWALAAADHDHATQLTARAMELLAKSMTADGAYTIDFDQAVMEFNDQQMRGRPKLQQQQMQPERNED